MEFFTLMGGLFVFGLLWLLVPRASFAVALAMTLKMNGVLIFSPQASGPTWVDLASILIICAFIIGAVMDISVACFIREKY